jgi:GAF domain-containing protein
LWTDEIEQVIATGELVTLTGRPSQESNLSDGPASDTPQRSALAAPIRLRGQTIGVLDFYNEGGQRRWTDDDKALVEALADQIAQALETQRLFEQTQRRAYRERLTSEIAGKIRAASDVHSILETAAEELGRALGVSRTLVHLGSSIDGSQLASSSDTDDKEV